MRKPLALCATAALALAFMGYDSSVLAADRDLQGRDITPGVATDGAQVKATVNLPAGITKADQMDNSGIHETLVNVVQAALNDKEFNTLGQYLSQNDRERLGDLTKGQNDQFNQTIQQFRQAWQQKYNQEFSLNGQTVFGEQFQNFTIVQGEVQNPTLLSNWPVDSSQSTEQRQDMKIQVDREKTQIDRDARVNSDMNDDGRFRAGVGGPGQPPFDVIPGQGNEKTPEADDAGVAVDTDIKKEGEYNVKTDIKNGEYDVNTDIKKEEYGAKAGTDLDDQPMKASIKTQGHDLKQGSEVALVSFPQQGNLQPLTVSLVQGDANKWHIDIPNTLSAEDLRTNLNSHLSYLLEHKDQWPADATQAQRSVAHHILAAFYDMKATGGAGGMMKGAGEMKTGETGDPQPQR